MAGYCVDCGRPLEQWEVPLSSDHLSVCAFCALIGESTLDNSMLTCCDDCGRPVEPEDTLEIDSLVVCIECWRPPIFSGISDYAHTPSAQGSRGQATRKSRNVKPAEPSRRAAADTDLVVDEGPARADLPAEESPAQTVKPGEESQPKPEESLDRVKVTVPARPASTPGTKHAGNRKSAVLEANDRTGAKILKNSPPPCRQYKSSETSKSTTKRNKWMSHHHCTPLVGGVLKLRRTGAFFRRARQGRNRQKPIGVEHGAGRSAGSENLREATHGGRDQSERAHTPG